MLLNAKNQKYKALVEKLYLRCQEIQTENERCVLRINTIKKMTRRNLRDTELLKCRLDGHNDNWRSLPLPMVAPHPKRKIEQKRGPKPKAKNSNPNNEESKDKKVRKKYVRKNAIQSDTTIANAAQDAISSNNNIVISNNAHQEHTEHPPQVQLHIISQQLQQQSPSNI